MQRPQLIPMTGFLAGEKVKEGGILNAGLSKSSFVFRPSTLGLTLQNSGSGIRSPLGSRTCRFFPLTWNSCLRHIRRSVNSVVIPQKSRSGANQLVCTTSTSLFRSASDASFAGAGSVLQHVIARGGKTNPPLFRGAMTSSTFLPSQYPFNGVVPEVCNLSSITHLLLTIMVSGSIQRSRFSDWVWSSLLNAAFISHSYTDGHYAVVPPHQTLWNVCGLLMSVSSKVPTLISH